MKFLCVESYEGERIVNTLITRMLASSKLSLVTLVLFRSLMELNCEDILLELVFKYLKNGNHLIGGIDHQLQRINDCNCLNDSAQRFLSLIPKCCLSSHLNYIEQNARTDGFVLLDNNSDSMQHNNAHNNTENGEQCSAKELQYLLFNYLDYLKDANLTISNCIRATRSWSCKYEAVVCSVNCNINNCYVNNNAIVSAINDNNDNHLVPQTNGSQKEVKDEVISSPIGLFLETLLSRLEAFCENDVFTNLQLTGLISRIASYPQPLLRSFLLNPTLVFHNIRSLFTILTEISKKLDQMSAQISNFDEMLPKARHFLYVRENRTLNRKQSFSSKIESEFLYNSRPTRSNSITSISSQTAPEGIAFI